MAPQKARRPPSVDCSSRPLGLRATKRRFVNLLQQLGRANNRGQDSAAQTAPLICDDCCLPKAKRAFIQKLGNITAVSTMPLTTRIHSWPFEPRSNFGYSMPFVTANSATRKMKTIRHG